MSQTVNEAIILGRLGKAPELRHTGSGKAVCSFSVATDNYDDSTEWHQIVAWEKTAEFIASKGRRGARVHVVGRIQTREWEKDGQKRSKTEVVVRPGGLTLLDWPDEGEQPATTPARTYDEPSTPEHGDEWEDDLPF